MKNLKTIITCLLMAATGFTACWDKSGDSDGEPGGENNPEQIDYNSLNSTWVTSLYDESPTEITINGSSAKFVAFGQNWAFPGWADVYAAGYVKKSDLFLKNIAAAGAKKWTCSVLRYTYNFHDQITGIEWFNNGKITLAGDGKTMEVESVSESHNSPNGYVYYGDSDKRKYYRKVK